MPPAARLGQLKGGNVYGIGWWRPRGGDTVYLYRERGRTDLFVTADPTEPNGQSVPYTWPRNRSDQDAAILAWKHYARKTTGR